MSAQAEEVTPLADVIKLVLSSIFVVAGIAAFYYFSDFQLLYRVVCLLIVLLASGAVVFTTVRGRAVWGFVLESKQEFKRIVWPTKDEAVRTTLLVFLMVFIVGLILWLLDMVLFQGVQMLMSQGIK